nr:fibronectin type III domain-containing protein [Lachnospiraceae bacterium]
ELEDNINPGDATVTIKGLGSFEGTAEATFVIAADFESAFGITADVNGDGTNDNSISVPTQLYTGAALTPAAEVVVGGETLRKDTDYIVDNVTFTAYDTDGNPTAGTVDITGNNKYYKNTYTASFDVTTDLSQVELTYSGLDDVIYTGEAQKLTNFKVYDPSGNTVTYDEDGVTYTSSSDGEECVEVGTVTVSIPITIGTVSDTVTTTYNIVQANIAAATYTGGANSTYRGTALTPPVVLYYRGNTLVANEDYTIVYDNNTNPTSTTSTGTTPDPATITITGINNFTGSYTQEFQIYPERMREVSATPVGSDGMTVSWDKLDNVTGYRIEVMTTSSSVPVKTVTVANASTTSTTITGLSEGTTYSFRAYSYVTVEGTTYYGLLNSITTATGIYTPQITVASNTTRRATLTWSVTNSGVKYMIYRSDTANGEYAYIARTTTDANSFTDKKLTSGRTYYYKIRAYRYPGEYGEYSDAAAVTVK